MREQTHRLDFRFADGVAAFVAVNAGETVLEAALNARLPMLYQCRSGSCGSCMGKLVAGEAGMRRGAATALLPREYAAGQRLLCLTEPHTDCHFELPYPAAAAAQDIRHANAFVNAVDRVAEDVIRLKLELAEGDSLTFRAGQFFEVVVPGIDVIRRYSPCTTPDELPNIELLVRLLPGGVMSDWLDTRTRVDDIIQLRGPFGAFFLRERQRVPHVFIAGGTGIAPILSIIDTVRKQTGKRPPMLLSFGCGSRESLFGLEDLQLRQLWLPNLTIRISVPRDPPAGVLQGTPVDALSPGDIDTHSIAYVCGPPAMVEAAALRLLALGVQADNIVAERFTAS